MSEEDKTFDADYVKSLRQEAAKYRTEVRDLESQLAKMDQLEAQVHATRVENELIRRGVEADPSWVPIAEGQSPTEAVDSFLEKWPHLTGNEEPPAATTTEETPMVKKIPEALPRDGKPNSPGPTSSGHFQGRTIEEIKEDPRARANLRDHYRDLIRQSSNITGEE